MSYYTCLVCSQIVIVSYFSGFQFPFKTKVIRHVTEKQQSGSIINWRIWSNYSFVNCWLYLFKDWIGAIQHSHSIKYTLCKYLIHCLMLHCLVSSSVLPHLKFLYAYWNCILILIWYLFRWLLIFCSGIIQWLWVIVLNRVYLEPSKRKNS